MITLKFTVTVQIEPEGPPPVFPAPRLKQSFFAWYEPEEKPPVAEAAPDRPKLPPRNPRQLYFPWYED